MIWLFANMEGVSFTDYKKSPQIPLRSLELNSFVTTNFLCKVKGNHVLINMFYIFSGNIL